MTQGVQEQAKTNALARFANTGPDHINCAQAVVAFALEMMGADPDLVAIAGYFGGGIAAWVRPAEPSRERPWPWACTTITLEVTKTTRAIKGRTTTTGRIRSERRFKVF
nr:hypothetical protein [uncultured bacterium]